MIFTPDCPPRSGQALRLWRWYLREAGEVPLRLQVCRPGRIQQNAGAAHYVISNDEKDFLVYDVPATCALHLADAKLDFRSGQYHLG